MAVVFTHPKTVIAPCLALGGKSEGLLNGGSLASASGSNRLVKDGEFEHGRELNGIGSFHLSHRYKKAQSFDWALTGKRKGLFQGLEAHALGLGALFAQTLFLVGFVLLVVAVKEHPLAVAFSGQDVGGDTVQEPAVMADHHH